MKKTLTLIATLTLAAPLTVSAKLTLGDLFADNMILQRHTAAPVWGTANPGEVVTLTLAPGDLTVSATANADGKWKAVFDNLAAAPSLTLTVSGTGAGDTLTVNNVAVGEVWVGSGQSNMQFLVSGLWPQDLATVSAVTNPQLRYFESPRWMEEQPADHFPSRKYKWITASPETSKDWSAVAWYFADQLHKELNVPVGVIGSSWGGTPAEPWVAREFLESKPEYKDLIDRALQEWQNREANAATYHDELAAWEQATGRADGADEGLQNGWAAPNFNDQDWTPIDTDKLQNWQSVGAAGGGVIWLRKNITVSAADAGKDYVVKLGEIGGDDTVWLNGEEIGRGGKNARERRRYTAPGKLVRAGENTLAVRIFARGGYRIFHDAFQATNPRAVFGVGEKLLLPDGSPATPDWRGKASRALPPLTMELAKDMPPNPNQGAGCVPALNFNGMVAPLMPYAIKGVLWYQGESNAAYAHAYRELLPLLVNSWR
ncbi:MAG: hypothetical protein LBK76_06570, partial [Verrucomicrobiales bacterium]|nr:hypothetical protein [Verrucomicrobiales bacterium]